MNEWKIECDTFLCCSICFDPLIWFNYSRNVNFPCSSTCLIHVTRIAALKKHQNLHESALSIALLSYVLFRFFTYWKKKESHTAADDWEAKKKAPMSVFFFLQLLLITEAVSRAWWWKYSSEASCSVVDRFFHDHQHHMSVVVARSGKSPQGVCVKHRRYSDKDRLFLSLLSKSCCRHSDVLVDFD